MKSFFNGFLTVIGVPHVQWNSIHVKLLSTYLFLVILGTSLMSGYILRSFYAYFMQTRQTELENWTEALSESMADGLEEQNIQQVQKIVRRYGAPETITLRVFDPQGFLSVGRMWLAASLVDRRHEA